MNSIKLSDLFKMDIKPFLFGAIMTRIMEDRIDGKKYFYAYTSFKSSKYVYPDEFNLIAYSDDLIRVFNRESGYHNWVKHSVTKTAMELRFYILNDLNIDKKTFYNLIYRNLQTKEFLLDEELNESKKAFIRGFCESRGSVDTTAKFIAQDYFYDSQIELKKAQILTDMMNLPIKYANFNMRELQPQYISGENQRNTQFRINAFYYAKEIGFINKYKATVFKNAYSPKSYSEESDITYFDVILPSSRNDDIVFIKMLNFFTNNIYQRELTNTKIEELRNRLGFSASADKRTRNSTIIKLYNDITKDECALCGTNITYVDSITGRQKFEIHHMLSFKNNPELDNIANLVKLCPTCHRKLGKGATSKESQLEAIATIYKKHQEVYEFASSYLALDDFDEICETTWEMLG